MPYIEQGKRYPIDLAIAASDSTINDAGELNYAITKLMLRYIKRQGLSYATLASVIGTMILATLELVMRLVRRYEDTKIRLNGDVDEYGDLLFPHPNPRLDDAKELGPYRGDKKPWEND